jgi:hypothetical protein
MFAGIAGGSRRRGRTPQPMSRRMSRRRRDCFSHHYSPLLSTLSTLMHMTLHDSRPLADTARVATWPGATRRALTAGERDWLEQVPAAPVVEFAGVAAGWPRSFFCGWVRHEIEAGLARIGWEDGQMVADMRRGRHVIRDCGSREEPAEVSPRPGQPSRRFLFLTGWKGGRRV